MEQLNIFDVTKTDDKFKRVILSRDLIAPFESKEVLNSEAFNNERDVWREHIYAVQDANDCNFIEARELLLVGRGIEKDDLIDPKTFNKIIIKAYSELRGIKKYEKELIEDSIDLKVYEKKISQIVSEIDFNKEINDDILLKLGGLLSELNNIESSNENITLDDVSIEDFIIYFNEAIEKERIKKFKKRIVSINPEMLTKPKIDYYIEHENLTKDYYNYLDRNNEM